MSFFSMFSHQITKYNHGYILCRPGTMVVCMTTITVLSMPDILLSNVHITMVITSTQVFDKNKKYFLSLSLNL